MGSDAIRAIIDGLLSLGGFGQLTAIEVFEEVGDPRCGPALIGLLKSENPTVREWAAMALASLDIDGAVEYMRRAYRACLERQTRPDWTEPGGIRWALTELGAAPLSSHRSPRACAPPLRMTPQGGPRPTSPRSSTIWPTTPRWSSTPSSGGWTPAARTASPARFWPGNSTGPRPGSTWSKSPAPGPCWKPPKLPPATTSSSPPPGSTVPTCTPER